MPIPLAERSGASVPAVGSFATSNTSAFNLSISVAPGTICDWGTTSCAANVGTARVTLTATVRAPNGPAFYPRVQVVFILETTPYDGGADPASAGLFSCNGLSASSLCNESDALKTFFQQDSKILTAIQAAHPQSNVSFAALDGFSTKDKFDDGDGSAVWGDITHFTWSPTTFAKNLTAASGGYPWGGFSGTGVTAESDLSDNFLHGPAITQIYGAIAGKLVNWTNDTHRVVVWMGSAAPRDPNYVENYSPTYSADIFSGCGASSCLAPTCEPAVTFSTGASPSCEGWVNAQDGQPGDSIASLALHGPDCASTTGRQCTIDIVNSRTVPTDPALTGWRYPNSTTVRTNANNVLTAGCDLSAATHGSWDGPSWFSCPDGRAGTLAVHTLTDSSATNDSYLIHALENISLGSPLDAGIVGPANSSEFHFVPGASISLAPNLNASARCLTKGAAVPCSAVPTVTTTPVEALGWNFSGPPVSGMYPGDSWSVSFDVRVNSLANGSVPVDRCQTVACVGAGTGAVGGASTSVQFVDPYTGNWTELPFDLVDLVALPPRPLAVSTTWQLLDAYAPASVEFYATGTGGVPPYSFNWTFGDASIGSSLNPADHLYTSSGSYAVELGIRDRAGEQTSRQLVIQIPAHPGPLAVQLAVAPYVFTVTTATILNASIVGGLPTPTFSWTGLPRGCLSANLSVLTCRPTSPGTYAVSVLVTDPSLATASASQVLQVNALPSVHLAWSGDVQSCSGSTMSPTVFVATVGGGTPPLAFAWKFGDGGNSTVPGTVDHVYGSLAPVTATVVVTDASGVNSSASSIVQGTLPTCAPGPPTTSAASGISTWIEVGAIVAVLAIAAVVVVMFRRRRATVVPAPSEPEP
ncbi:MAG: PKD domain-containing protein [Thermoplasmata archaeon]|nr:PKD domain-containing protein [Thermoplasmata archaeon]